MPLAHPVSSHYWSRTVALRTRSAIQPQGDGFMFLRSARLAALHVQFE
jgi:hypothetical protein